MIEDKPLKIGDTILQSRLLLGTSRYPHQQMLMDAIAASGTQCITASIRRFNPHGSHMQQLLLDYQQQGIHILPNTAGCYTAKEAILTAQLSREALQTNWIKLEVIGDEKTLFPDMTQTVKAAQTLIEEGFVILVYCNDDLIACRKLAELGVAAVMPLGSPIGSGMGILNPYNLAILRDQISIPLILDAGIGTAQDVIKTMELGFDGVLVNTAIAQAQLPVQMANAMKLATESGRLSYLAGRIPTKRFAQASSPIEGMIT